ncbi:MAG TPA: hypothetical protein VFZ65_07705 [Planctomycetota bacterium]|nr:hypothetical protein [Planctomycetota bacterium]
MQLSHAVAVGAAVAALVWTFSVGSAGSTGSVGGAGSAGGPGSPVAPAAPPTPPEPPRANGHYVLVVEGDRDRLTITSANAKTDPWAGVPVGFASDWTLCVRDGGGAVLAEVPLDLTPFATSRAEKGQPVQVQGCIVRDSRIAMLVSVPRFDTAASYTFSHRDAGADRTLGTVTGDAVRELAGGGR